MAIRDIIVVEHPVLRKKARKVEKVTPEIRALIDDMIDTMRDAPGVGLAAPQVNVGKRVIVVEYAEDEDAPAETPEGEPLKPARKKLYTVVNPEVVFQSDETVEGAEGCLSIPGWMGLVDRRQAIGIKGLDRNGRPFKLKADGWLARIFQHEIDHLNGVLFLDHIKSPDKLWRTPPPEAESEAEAKPRAARFG
jgi:peptide deformylase